MIIHNSDRGRYGSGVNGEDHTIVSEVIIRNSVDSLSVIRRLKKNNT